MQKSLLGFASGVMVAAGIWSLLIPAIDMSESMGRLAFIPAASGFGAGILFLLIMDKITPHLHLKSATPEGPKSALKKRRCLSLRSLYTISRKEWRWESLLRAFWRREVRSRCPERLPLPWGSPFRTFRKALSFPCLLERGNGKSEVLSIRDAFRHCRTDSGACYDSAYFRYKTLAALPSFFCSRSHAVCGRGGIDTGGVRRQALRCRDDRICRRFYHYDGLGCGAWLKLSNLLIFYQFILDFCIYL